MTGVQAMANWESGSSLEQDKAKLIELVALLGNTEGGATEAKLREIQDRLWNATIAVLQKHVRAWEAVVGSVLTLQPGQKISRQQLDGLPAVQAMLADRSP